MDLSSSQSIAAFILILYAVRPPQQGTRHLNSLWGATSPYGTVVEGTRAAINSEQSAAPSGSPMTHFRPTRSWQSLPSPSPHRRNIWSVGSRRQPGPYTLMVLSLGSLPLLSYQSTNQLDGDRF
ncbi:hypothetical protein SUGI_1481830 [Cryptomeria japonica]|uniref:Uncharacterized protein n=1 Tax=Cryptomeria japonica TaxID=3369 RepID=A0AAD3RPL0_CRYJA|nr:hypothetical protein SUGI_1481830 [Cryptomeria japonica]